MEFTFSLGEIFGSLFGLAAAVLAVTAWIKKKVESNNTLTIVISVLVSFALSAIGWFIQEGIFNAIEWWYIFVYGVAAMAIANGLSTWDWIKAVLVFFKLRVPQN